MKVRLMKWVAFVAFAGTLATGCASTGSMTASHAPITYKGSQGVAVASAPDHRTNRGDVDRELYSHMKVGGTYTVMGQTFTPRHDPDYDRTGTASWYGPKFHGKLTANGETFDKRAMTAAHPTLALNSYVRVTNLENGKAVTVRLNDRGPFVGGRMIDMSEAAAERLGFKRQGTARVRVQYIGPANAADSQRSRRAPRLVEAPKIAPVQPAPRLATPAPRRAAPAPAPRYVERQAPAPRQAAPVAPRSTPQAPMRQTAPRVSGGTVTMTIKGPIHLANSSDAHPEPELIAEPLKTR